MNDNINIYIMNDIYIYAIFYIIFIFIMFFNVTNE